MVGAFFVAPFFDILRQCKLNKEAWTWEKLLTEHSEK